jgi:glucokinase
MRILAGDIGGTKTDLCLYEGDSSAGFREAGSARFRSAEHAGPAELVHQLLGSGRAPLDAAVFGVAGPVRDGHCKTTNLAWELDEKELSRQLCTEVVLINDFHAVALGIGELDERDLEVLNPGRVDPDGPIAVIGAGTGLGEAIAVPVPGQPYPLVIVTEGGHTDFGPRNETEVELLRFLQQQHRHVSYERVVSGGGLASIYDFVISWGLVAEKPETRDARREKDPGRVIGESALRRTDPACERAVEIFVSLYGAEAGNLALKCIPSGGLFVAGGMAPKLLEIIRRGAFLQAFLDKGRMSAVLERIRVSVVLNRKVSLLGARARALQNVSKHYP